MKQDLSIRWDVGLLVLHEEKSSMQLWLHLRFFFPPGRRIPSILAASKVPFHDVMTIGDFTLGDDLSRCTSQAGKVIIYHSHDDEVVPFISAQKYLESIPQAHLETFEDRGHFNQETFPELEETVKKLAILRLTGAQASLQATVQQLFSDCQPVRRNLIEFFNSLDKLRELSLDS